MAEIEPGPDNDYQVSPTLTFSRALWNAVMLSIATRLKAREALEATFEELVASGTQAALDLISSNVAPQLEDLIEQINALETQLEDIIGGGTAPNALQLAGQNPSYYLALANATGTLPAAQVSGIDTLIAAAVAALVNAAPSQLDTLKELADALGGDANFSASVTASLAAKTAKAANLSDLPDKDAALVNLLGGGAGIQLFKRTTMAQVRSDLQIDRWNRARDRIINGSMRFDQRGAGTVDFTSGAGCPVDRWQVFLSTTPGGTLRAQQIATPSPGGGCRLRLTAQVADASLAAGDVYMLQQLIEGANVADARFGTASAKQVILRFGAKSSVAGDYTVALCNSASDRSWCGSFTIAAGEVSTEVVKSIAIPGDVAGTWLTDNGIGMAVRIVLATGSNAQGIAGWQPGNKFGLAGQVNFMATGGATFELFDVGLYVDHDATGIVPPWTLPNYADELRDCMRYFQMVRVIHDFYAAANSQVDRRNWLLPVVMRSTGSIASISNINVANATFNAVLAGPVELYHDVSSGAAGYVGASRLYGVQAEF